MRPLRLRLADLRPHQRVLLQEADPRGTVEEPQSGDSGAAESKTGVRQPRAGKGRGAGRFRLTQPEPAEAVVLKAVLTRLRMHPRVAWVERLNSGAGQLAFADGSKSQWLRFSWRGAPDLIGQLVDGRILCVEAKRPSGRLRPEQELFLATVKKQGGCAFVARSIDDVEAHLGR